MLFHQKLRHNMDVKLNKALEERYLQIVSNQRQKQMREERKKAALTSTASSKTSSGSSSGASVWLQHDVDAWVMQSRKHLTDTGHHKTSTATSLAPVHSNLTTSSANAEAAIDESDAMTSRAHLNSSNNNDNGDEHLRSASTSSDPMLTSYTSPQMTSGVTNFRNSKSLSDSVFHDDDDVTTPTVEGESERGEERREHDDDVSAEELADERGEGAANERLENTDTADNEKEPAEAVRAPAHAPSDDARSSTSQHPAHEEDLHEDDAEREQNQQRPHLHSHSVFPALARSPQLTDATSQHDVRTLFPHAALTLPVTRSLDASDVSKKDLDRLLLNAFQHLSGLATHSADVTSSAATAMDGDSPDATNNSSTSKPGLPSGSASGSAPLNHGSGSTNAAADDCAGNDDSDAMRVDFPSLFPGLKQQLSIRNETVVISRLDGVDSSTGDNVTLYKCHLCGRIYKQLSQLQLHLSTHFERRVVVFQCLHCDSCFRYKVQLTQHLQLHHSVELNLEEGQVPEVCLLPTIQ